MSKFLLVFTALFMNGPFAYSADAHEMYSPRLNIVFRIEIIINSEPDKVWPYVHDYRMWLPDVVLKQSISGTHNSIGEIVKYKKSSQLTFMQSTIEQRENRWLVKKMYPEVGRSFLGYDSFRLDPVGKKTRLTLEKYMDYGLIDLAGYSQDEIYKEEQKLRKGMSDYLQKGFYRIKRLVENPQNKSSESDSK